MAMVMRYAHHHPESLWAGAEVLDRLTESTSTKRAQPIEKATSVPSQVVERFGAPGPT